MSRKSVIQLVPAPTGCGDASDLRYRLLMAALGSSDEVNPLLVRPDAAREADEVLEADSAVESAPVQANQNALSVAPPGGERSSDAGPEGQPPSLSLVRPQTPLRSPVPNAASETPAPAGAAPLPRPRR